MNLRDKVSKILCIFASAIDRFPVDLLQKSENTLKPSASIGVYLPDICGCSMTRIFLQEV
jgi:hypothetical protein